MDIGFRPLRHEDLPLVDAWLAEPHVADWWPESSLGISAEASFGPSIAGKDPTEVFVVELSGRPIGLAQHYLLADYPPYAAALGHDRAAGIDYLIGEVDLVGAGVGPMLIDRFTALTFRRYPQIDDVAVAVQQANRRSWRALEKSGFARAFTGMIESDDPSDRGPSFVYLRRR